MAAAIRAFCRWGIIVTLAAVLLRQFPVAGAASGLREPDEQEDRQSTNSAHDEDQRRPAPDHLGAEAPLSPPPVDLADVSETQPSQPPRDSAFVSAAGASVEDEPPGAAASALARSELLNLADLEDDARTTAEGARPRRPLRLNIFRRRGVRSGRQGRMSATRRLFVLLVFLFFSALSGAIFCGFKPLARMMAAEHAYAELCPPNSTAVNSTTGAGNLTTQTLLSFDHTDNGTLPSAANQTQLYRCSLQEASVEGLYTFALATACVVSSVAGPLIDSAGPRAAHFAGSVMHLVGLVLFALQHYTLGMMMLTAGEQTSFLASVTLAQHFPRSRGTVLGLLGALASLSALVPLCLREIRRALGTSLRNVMLGYAAGVGVPGLLAGVIFLPPRANEESLGAGEVGRRASLPSVRNDGPVEDARVRRLLQRLQFLFGRMLQTLRRFLTDPALRTALSSRSFLYIFLIFTIASISSSYFIQGATRIFHGSAPSYLDIFFPLAAVPCALLGLIPDRWGSSVAILLLGLAGLIMNLSSFFENTPAGYVGVVALVGYICALTSQVFWYTMEAFPRHLSGTVSGAVLMAGGLLSLIANPLYSDLTLEVLDGNTQWVRGGIGVFQVLQLLLVYLAYREVRRQNGHGARTGRRPRFHRRRRTYTLSEHPRIRELPDD